jgi:hypothetical protein
MIDQWEIPRAMPLRRAPGPSRLAVAVRLPVALAFLANIDAHRGNRCD